MILDKQSFKESDFEISSFVTIKDVLEIIKDTQFEQPLIDIYSINPNSEERLQLGNAKQLLAAINSLESQCKKIDIPVKMKNLRLKTLLDGERALFEIFGITDNFILTHNKSDLLVAETRYSAKADILDHYSLTKFANYCRDCSYLDLIDTIKDYIVVKNVDNDLTRNLRLVYKKENDSFYIRAITSRGYKNYGINFSVFVAIKVLSDYIKENKRDIFIDNFIVDDSNVYVSFSLKNQIPISDNLSLTFNLILQNDEVKREAVSFNGIFKLTYKNNNHTSSIFIKPTKIKEKDGYRTDLLTYPHQVNVETVFKKLGELPTLIDHFVKQVTNDAKRISKIEHPDDVKKLINDKIKDARKPEFRAYQAEVVRKLTSMNVDNTFKLFDLLRNVEELFDHHDIISINFWRSKLYEALIEGE